MTERAFAYVASRTETASVVLGWRPAFGAEAPASRCASATCYSRSEDVLILAAHIEATRAIERYGVASIAAMFTGFQALPSPDAVAVPHWTRVLEVDEKASKEQALTAYRRKRAEHHPDRCGDASRFHIVEAAFRMAEQEGRA